MEPIKTQHNKFKLPVNVTYLNCAFMSPLLRTVEKEGHAAVSQKCFPYQITREDFFKHTYKLKQLFSQLVSIEDVNNCAIIPSVSYGIATLANNIVLNKGDEILIVGEQFPSNVYSWKHIAKKYEAKIVIISPNRSYTNRGKDWNRKIFDAINCKTKVVAMAHIHWSDGTLFDLKKIRFLTKQHNAYLFIDGTQSIGALPFSVKEIQPDALICASYKWLLGPYSIGIAYYSNEICKGIPIEENWINRKNSENFANLVNYEDGYQPKAGRFNVGEMSNFALTPMLIKAIEQLLNWKPEKIQEYCKNISKKAIIDLQNLGCFIEKEKYRSNHLFGIYLPKEIAIDNLKEQFKLHNVYVSFRGNAVRVSPHLYNTIEDFDTLVLCFKNAMFSK